ncbi:MAG TPA: ATP-binding protein [Bacillota bacterium]|nr:ATP-binding protein [Bacillota bacterium]HPZ91251.1 ATP-binding protein [Bacillota bacterium]
MKSIQWKLVLIYILLLVFALELFGVYMLSSVEKHFTEDLQKGLHNQVRLISLLAERYFAPQPDSAGLQQLVKQYSNLVGREIYLLDKYGIVVAAPPGQKLMEGKKIVQPEVVSAVQGTADSSIRFDPHTGYRVYYYSEPIYQLNSLVGVVYASASLQNIDRALNTMRNILLTGAVWTLLLSAILGLNLSSTITRPLQKITSRAEAMKSGDFRQKIDIRSRDEIGRLAETFNDLAAKLQQSWDEVIQEKDKIEGILANLSDGLIVFDHSGKVMHINSTACNWFGLNKQVMLSQGTAADFPQLESGRGIIYLEGEMGIVLRQQRLPFLQAGKKQGTIVVLSDITEQHRLDRMRQEFVANVSHELRTPLTTIKTYLEALLENPDEDSAIQRKFLKVIDSEAERMVRMVEDLLILSRSEIRTQEFKLVSIGDIIRDIVQGVEVEAANKGLMLEVRIPKDLPPVLGDRDQLYRLFLNIVNNALSYTAEGSIKISVFSRNKYVEVTVADTGIGIPAHALSRIFERFYRVDKARSRKAGGTGLGLSIAKQIAELHGGTINIISREGHGTEVIVPLPVAPENVLESGAHV